MPIPIQLKRNGTASETPSSLLHGEVALNYADGKLFWKDASNVIQSFTFQAYALSSHTHGNITNAGAIGSTANLPVITTTSGVLTTGTFGTAANSFCQGNDARLSDTRTPTDGSVTTAKIADANVTYAKIQNVSATDRLLGRSSAGAGVVEEITCTAFGRSLIDDADAAAARTTLSVQPTASPTFTGRVGIGAAANAIAYVHIDQTAPSSGGVTQVIRNTVTIPSTSSDYWTFLSAPTTQAASFTLSAMRHFVVAPQAFGDGSTVTNQFGYVVESGMTGATNNYGFYSNIASGTGRWNFYSNGTAPSFFGGQLLVTAGSASAPGVAFSGDTNTGMYSPSADVLAWATNGVERVRVDASGNVGIGASPGTTLDIQRASADAAVFVQGQTSSTGATVQIYSGAGLGYVGTRTNHPLIITSNNAERVRVKTTGSVRFVPLSADPASGNEAGDVYYNSSTNKLRVYNGTSWVDLH